MDTFSLTDFTERLDEIIASASRGPIKIATMNSGDFVLLSTDDYANLLLASNARRAIHADTVPHEIAELMVTALERKDN